MKIRFLLHLCLFYHLPHTLIMILFRESKALQEHLEHQRKNGHRIGFVPTMGALHAGHLSLIEAAAAQSDTLVCSIFVNPTQFNDPKDFEHYPVRTDQDIYQLSHTPAQVLFLPDVKEIYPQGTSKLPHYDFGDLENMLEGAYRPGHFQGVGQVMQRLLEIVRPDTLCMGQKDYQQCLIVQRLIGLLGLNTHMVICPTQREPDGLAMSSRNLRLSDAQRQQAPLIHECLQWIRSQAFTTPFAMLKQQVCTRLEEAGFRVDYVAIARAADLQLLEAPADAPMIALIAAYTGEIRLIDNLLLQ